MSILDQVSEQLKEAMRSKDKDRLNGLRGIRAAFIETLKVDGATTLPDDKAFEVLKRLAKQRKESIDAYVSAGRQDLVDAERAELSVIESFLPKAADEATTRAWVQAAIAEAGAASAKDTGRVMKILMAAHKSEIDGAVASRIVRELLPN